MPGSGKSTLIDKLRPKYPGIVAPDFHADAYNNSSKVTDSKNYAPLIKALREGKDSIIADIEFCDTWRRWEVEQVIKLDVQNVTIEWYFFENDPQACKKNAQTRNRPNLHEEIQKIDALSRKYFVPGAFQRNPVVTA